MKEFDIRFKGIYKSISSFEWVNIPMLSIIVGANGVGKTHLLNLIHLIVLKNKIAGNLDQIQSAVSTLELDDQELISSFSYSYFLPTYNDSKGLSIGDAYSLPIALKSHSISKEIKNVIFNREEKLNEKYSSEMTRLNELLQKQDSEEGQESVKLELQQLHSSYNEEKNKISNEVNIDFTPQRNKLSDYKKNLPSSNQKRLEESEYDRLVEKIERISSKKVLDMSLEEILYYFPVNEIINDRRDFLTKLDFLVVIHEEKTHLSQLLNINDDKYTHESPIELINRALSYTSLTLRLKTNSRPDKSSHLRFFSSAEHMPILFDEKNGIENINYHDLSSGEKMLMSLALKLYVDNQSYNKAKLMLMDEPDAYLHPSMMIDFYKIVYDFFVKERGVRVIFTTHSPTAVALAPENSNCSIFELSKPTEIKIVSNEKAIEKLSEGLVTVTKTTKFVLVEGKEDKPFYSKIYKKLVRDGIIPSQPSLIFIPGKNKEIVKHFVKELGESQSNYFGIIDKDHDLNSGYKNVFTLERYCIENYLSDPIVSFFTSRKNFDGFKKFDIERTQISELDRINSMELQKLVSYVINSCNIPEDWDRNSISIEFENGHVLKYPNWFFYQDGKKGIFPLIKSFLGTPQGYNNDYLLDNMILTGMIPKELTNIFRQIIEA